MELPNSLLPTFILKILANLTIEFHYRTTISTQIVALYKLPILVGSGFLILILIPTINPFSVSRQHIPCRTGLEPIARYDPTTCCLQNSCSTN